MLKLKIIFASLLAAACSASMSPPIESAPRPAPVADTLHRGHAAVNLTGPWATGSAGEPTARQIVLRPQCNYSPALWAIEQSGDTVRAWTIPESRAQGVPSPRPGSTVPAEGLVSGVDLTMGTSGARYLLRYDSTSGHLRGTLNGAPFWAVRLDIVRPEGCIAVP